MPECSENKVDMKYYLHRRNILFDYFLTTVICVLVAIVITLIGSHEHFLKNLVMSESFGISICSTVLFLLWAFKPQNWKSLLLIVVLAVFAGAIAGLQLGVFILEHFLSIHLNWPMRVMIQTLAVAMVFSAGFLYIFMTKSKLKHRKEMIEEERIKTVALQKEALEANLRMLQAQIEPHFLFNTLSNVVSLIDTDPARGKAMLLDLTKYLRTSLSRTMPEKTTLAQEMDMIRAYLNIQKIRMGDRLNFILDAPDVLRVYAFPPMLLQPLVENAVKHGLEPKMEGGEIIIRATQDNQMLKVEVTDSGLGISSLNSSGVGMANVRKRLNLLFGDDGKFIIEENAPSGVKATIEVPIHD